MLKAITIASVIILTGCVATAPTYQSDSSVASSQIITASPKWELLTDGSDLTTNINYKYYPDEMKLSNNMLLRGQTWNGFLKDYVNSFPPEKRDGVLRALTRFYKEYDKVDKIIKFEPLRYASGPYSSNSYVSLEGSLTKSKANALLTIRYYGSSWIFAHRITIVADDFTWNSPELEFYRDHYTNVWEYTFFDISNPEYRKIADKIVSSKEAIIRFHGKEYYSDLEVTERMKKDMSAMLKAIDFINGRT